MSRHNDNNTDRGRLTATAMVDVVLERDGICYIATPGQAFPFAGERTTRHGTAALWLYYGVKRRNAYCTSKRTAHEILECIVDDNKDAPLLPPGGVHIMGGETHPSMICTTGVEPEHRMLRVYDMTYLESRSRECMACAKRLLPYAYVPYKERLHKDCPTYQVHEMYIPRKKGTEMEKVNLIRTDFPISFSSVDNFIRAEDMKSPDAHNIISAYQMYNLWFFLRKYGFDDNEIYVGWAPEEPQYDKLITRQEYETLLYGQDRTFRLKASAPYNPNDPFGFFDVSRKHLNKAICAGEWNPTILPSLY